MENRRQWNDIFKVLRKLSANLTFCILKKYLLRMEVETDFLRENH